MASAEGLSSRMHIPGDTKPIEPHLLFFSMTTWACDAVRRSMAHSSKESWSLKVIAPLPLCLGSAFGNAAYLEGNRTRVLRSSGSNGSLLQDFSDFSCSIPAA